MNLGSGIAASDVSVELGGEDLYLRFSNSPADQVILTGWLRSAADNIEQIRFFDGTIWDTAYIGSLFNNPTGDDDYLVGTPGTDLLNGGGGNDIILGGGESDNLYGGDGNDFLYGDFGSLYGSGVLAAGNDVLIGGAGDDQLAGEDANDLLDGGTGNDILYGGAGDDRLLGGDGDDYLLGDSGTNVFDGGAGNDILDAISTNEDQYSTNAELNNTYIITRGGGVDTILTEDALTSIYGDVLSQAQSDLDALSLFTGDVYTTDFYAAQYFANGSRLSDLPQELFDKLWVMSPTYGGPYFSQFGIPIGLSPEEAQATITALADWLSRSDSIQFGQAISPDDLQIRIGRNEYNNPQLYIGIGNDEGVVINAYGNSIESIALRRFTFADGQELSLEQILARGTIASEATGADDFLQGIPVDDFIDGQGGNDQIEGLAGNDTLWGSDGNDVISGGAGNDDLAGSQGDDILAGAKGDDLIYGGSENDVYLFNRGDGHDLINNWESPADLDIISFGLGIQPGDVHGHVDSEGRLVLTFGGDDSITLYWFDTYNGNAILPEAIVERVQFVAKDGTRVFDFAGIVATLATGLLLADAANPVALFTPATAGFELTGTVAPVSEEHVIAYGLTGDLFAVAAQHTGGTGTNDTIRGTAGDDTITDLGGDNTILAGDGNNVVTTGGGNDTITTGSGNDTIAAGAGMDRMSGGAGNDTYYFNLGDGVDLIDDLAGPGEGNRVVFGAGIAPGDLTLSFTDSTLAINVGAGGEVAPGSSLPRDPRLDPIGDGLRLSNFDPSNPLGTHAIDSFEFSDGTVLSYAELIGHGLGLAGTGTDDLLIGTGVADRIDAQGGNDVIVGGAGNDLLDGGSGNDLYVFNLGDGVDTILDRASPGVGNSVVFGPGITSADLALELDTTGASPALLIHVGNGGEVANGPSLARDPRLGPIGDAIRLDGFNPEDATGPRAVETFRFADGTSLSYDQLLSLGIAVNGTTAQESLTGTSVRDRLSGAGGNDRLTGGEGDDAYFFNAGDGVVSINDTSSPFDPNTVVFGSGITPENLQLDLDAATGELILRVGLAGDAVRLSGFNPDDPYGAHAIEFYRFTDGTVLTYSQLIDRGFDVLGTNGNDDLPGTATADRITGSAGHDLIRGGAGGDSAAGGAGDDTYVYRIGDGILTIDDLATIGEGNTLEFGEGIALADLRNRLSYLPPAPGQDYGTFIIRIGEGTGDEVRLANFNPDDADLGAHAVDLFRFADGTTVNYRQLVQNTFIVQGDTGDDSLRGTNLTDRLYGYEGSDTLRGQLGNDTLTGGTGNDELHGEEGDDTYVFNLGDGIDTIHETANPAAPNRIVFGAGIALSDLRFEQVGNLLTIQYGSLGDAIRLPNFNFSNVGGTVVVTTLEFGNGSTADLATLMNQSPVLDTPLADTTVRVEDVLSYAVPAGAFSDPDVGDTLSYSASLADGSALPAWVQFDASNGSFTGTPALGDLGALDVRVTATDALGLSVSDNFTLSVVPRNRAPEVAQPLADLAVDEDVAAILTVPADAFVDPDADDTLTYTATLADGTALPTWLTFDADTRTFTGTPTNGDVGALDIRVTVTDREGASVSDAFTLTVNNVNDAPVLANALADRSTTEGQAFSFTLDPATFADDDAIHGDTLSFSATLADGSALPGWLSFDSSSQTFSGTSPDDSTVTGTDGDDVMVSDDVDTVHTLRVTATDTGGLSVSDDFALTVHDASPDDVYDGRGGNDMLDTGLGNDTLTGGTGHDTLLGGVGNDTYIYNPGDGLDALTDTDGVDTLRFGNGITAEQVVVRLDTAAGLARLRFLDADGCESTDQGIDITLNADGSLPIETIRFADGGALSPADLVIQSLVWYGTNQADVLTAGRHDDTIHGGNGQDVLTSGSGNDTLYGENGNDRLYGQGGNDTLTGGRGDDLLDGGCGDDILVADQGEDTLIGGQGNDTILLGQGEHTIRFGTGDGQDTIRRPTSDDDAEAEVVFGPGIDPNKLWFARSGNDLTVQLLGTGDGMTLEGWYNAKHKPIEEFQTADGSELEGKQIERLVQAMAQFAPSLSADGTLPTDQQQELNAVIAAAWESGH